MNSLLFNWEEVSRGRERESGRQMNRGGRNKMNGGNDEERGERMEVEKPKSFMLLLNLIF